MEKVSIYVIGLRPAGCCCGPNDSCEPTRTILDDLQDLKANIQQKELGHKVESFKFIDLFSKGLDSLPQIKKKIEAQEVSIPLVCFGEEVISSGEVNIDAIINALDKK